MASRIEKIQEAEQRVADLQAKLELVQGGLQRVEAAAKAAGEVRAPARRGAVILAAVLGIGLVALLVARRRRRSTDDAPDELSDPTA